MSEEDSTHSNEGLDGSERQHISDDDVFDDALDEQHSQSDAGMDFEEDEQPQEVCLISTDSLKYGDYKLSPEQHVVRVTHKDILIDAVTFHPNSLQIDFHCLNDSDPLLRRYGIDKSVQLVWHAELAGELVPEECEMRSGEREFVLKKRDPAQWTSGLLQCSSASAIGSSPTFAASRPSYSSRSATSYRYSNASSLGGHAGLPPTGQSAGSSNHHHPPVGHTAPTYHRSSFSTSTRIDYSPHTYVPPAATAYSSNTYSPSVRSRSTSSLTRRSTSSSVLSVAPTPSSPLKADISDTVYSNTLLASKPPPPLPLMSPAVRPTAKVSPYEEKGTVVDPGFTGLRNIGNTCFMNATLQMLVNCKELQIFFTGDYYKKDINATNPLGFGGRLAEVFAEFMKQMWSGMNRAFEPTKVKELVAEKAPQFANFAQHDAHEFLSFLLDGLHEDLNRVRSKPYTTTVEANGRPDIEVSNEAWANHLLRNDSVFVDLFHGQLKSRLQCPRCDQVSITFDPFVYLAVPFPKEKRSSVVYFWPLDPCLKPIKFAIRYSADGTVSEMLDAVSQLVHVPTKSLRLIEVCNHRIARVFQPNFSTSQISSTDPLYVFQVHDASDCNEETVELIVVQRLLYRKSLMRACANCHATDEKLKSCERCYDALYCKRECQVEHWAKEHKFKCKLRSQAEAVGEPFIISLPKSKATYANIMRNLECRCRYSVNVFQPPVESSTNNNNNNGTLSTESSDTSGDVSLDLSPSPSLSSINANGNDTNTNPPPVPVLVGVKRQMVLGEPRNKSRLDSRLFIVRRLQQPESIIGESLVDTHEPLDIPSGTFLSINWHNMKCGKDYLTVESKVEVDIDAENSAIHQRAAQTIASNGSSAANPSLYDMLTMFSETERLKPEESWYCNKCKEHVEATKRLQLYRLPPILIIQLKRFVYTTSIMSMHRRSKDDRPVRYPISDLDLSDFLSETAPNGQTTKYDLTGVVCHSGSSYFGHYISMGRLESLDGKTTEIDWRNFDDSMVSRITPSRVQNDDAYLLFYKQRDNQTQQLLKRRYGIDLKL
uniref:ubiquitinyl hydrolase 1 n=1 Tax=Ascaris suum TaxID=6253 RepID=F1KRM8_ASCSU